ncbi:MAG: hypothetical protein ABWZ98_02520 [Nakamurella sp.]
MDSTNASANPSAARPEKFSLSLLKFAGTILAGAVGGVGLIILGLQFEGILTWVFVIAGIALVAGVALYGSALSGEVRRKWGPLPLGRPDQDLRSMPFYQGRNK